MNELTQFIQEEGEYKIIHPSMKKEFEGDIIDSYILYAESEKLPIVTNFYHSDHTDFPEHFSNAWSIGVEALMRSKFPEDRWSNFTMEEHNEHAEMACDELPLFDEKLLEDILGYYDRHKIFYIYAYERGNELGQLTTLEIEGWENSPIQEVW